MVVVFVKLERWLLSKNLIYLEVETHLLVRIRMWKVLNYLLHWPLFIEIYNWILQKITDFSDESFFFNGFSTPSFPSGLLYLLLIVQWQMKSIQIRWCFISKLVLELSYTTWEQEIVVEVANAFVLFVRDIATVQVLVWILVRLRITFKMWFLINIFTKLVKKTKFIIDTRITFWLCRKVTVILEFFLISRVLFGSLRQPL